MCNHFLIQHYPLWDPFAEKPAIKYFTVFWHIWLTSTLSKLQWTVGKYIFYLLYVFAIKAFLVLTANDFLAFSLLLLFLTHWLIADIFVASIKIVSFNIDSLANYWRWIILIGAFEFGWKKFILSFQSLIIIIRSTYAKHAVKYCKRRE